MGTEIVNTSGWNTPWLRKVIRFCCRELEFPPKGLRKATFSLSHRGSFKGKAYLGRGLITARINPLNEYPYAFKNKKALPEFRVQDAVELVVFLTAHELAHLRFPERTEQQIELVGRRVTLEFARVRDTLLPLWGDPGTGPVHAGRVYRWECVRCGRQTRSARPRKSPERLSCGGCFAAWKEAEAAGEFLRYSVEVPERSPTVRRQEAKSRRGGFVEVRAQKAQAMLSRWERKLKLARTKVKHYSEKVKYYRRRGVLPGETNE